MLKKPTNHIIKNKKYKRRYFKLSMEFKLWYFIGQFDLHNKDMIDLNYMTSIKKRAETGLEIYETRGRNKWLFTCDSKQERDEWYNIMILAYQSKQVKENNTNNDGGKDNVCLKTDKSNKNIMVY